MPEHTGEVFFEIAVDATLDGDLREKLRQAAYNKVQSLDLANKRVDWRFPNAAIDPPQPDIETEPPRMPAFIKNECFRELGSSSDAFTVEPVLLEAGSQDYYCYPGQIIICYHKYRLLNPDDGLYIKVSATHEGAFVVTDLLVVLTYATPQ